MKPSISVLTPTNRHGGIDINWSGLRRQQFTDFEWILYDTLYDERQHEVKEYTKFDPRVVHLKQEGKDPLAKTWLNHAQNQAFLASKGELIVLLQDYIHVLPDALAKFWAQYQANPNHFVSGVGHQYGSPGREQVVDPKGPVTLFARPFEQQPSVIVWTDPRVREDLGSFYPCNPADWEANWAMIPRKAIEEIGGWDESYDAHGHAWDNVSIAERAYLLGYEPYLDQSNKSYSVRHEDFFPHPVKHNDSKEIQEWHIKRLYDLKHGIISLPFTYLDNYRKNERKDTPEL